MTPFDRLHPALKHHVVNSLGWSDLRPFQHAVIDPVLAGRHLLILAPTAGGKTEAATAADVRLDYVGSLPNAAVVISRLHRGEKRLVFVDSRSRAEQLGRELRSLEVATFITHSSLSQDERRQAEGAFAGRDDCVIVATSVLELGIDVGDLHRVIQIDAPATVSSFLQRMGRTGRRGARRRPRSSRCCPACSRRGGRA